MTLLQVRNQLVQHFCNNDTLSAADLGQFEVPKELETRKDELVRAVLTDLVDAGMIRCLPERAANASTSETQAMWILTSPMGSAGQEIAITLPTAAAMADEINAFADAFNEDWPEADALRLSEQHVLMLLSIIAHLRSEDFGDEDAPGGGQDGSN